MRRALGAVWSLVLHPLRSSLRAPSRRRARGVYDDHGAQHATPTRRRWWWALQLFPAALWAALAVWRMTDGELALGIAFLCGALALAITTLQIRSAYLTGFLRGAVQVSIDVRARSVGRPYDANARALPHPADPTPDLSALPGRVVEDD